MVATYNVLVAAIFGGTHGTQFYLFIYFNISRLGVLFKSVDLTTRIVLFIYLLILQLKRCQGNWEHKSSS